MQPGCQPYHQLPFSERISPEILPQIRVQPRCTVVAGNADLLDALAAVKCDAFDERLARAHLSAIGQIRDEGSNIEAGDWNRCLRCCSHINTGTVIVRNAI